MAHLMSEEALDRFLSEGTRTGKLATVRADGRPHVAPVWFILDGPDLVFMTAADSLKGRPGFYNPQRIQKRLGYRSPADFESAAVA